MLCQRSSVATKCKLFPLYGLSAIGLSASLSSRFVRTSITLEKVQSNVILIGKKRNPLNKLSTLVIFLGGKKKYVKAALRKIIRIVKISRSLAYNSRTSVAHFVNRLEIYSIRDTLAGIQNDVFRN